ncbi:ABC transporter ATP-binding protein [aff. Roholtiella sp. LEGE 12411]|uniref:ABC transporter ATP-binding protein n=1 Tax=aff. Roholtiella sp. LEGE 12411 TaxID=1828822 RepID=UPI00188228B6|nr:ABC transporter ATP-binding protein [aff. Roholtiella sp. LEGE 12411]MBE9036789.1 ABC transporter ATP-binding protein [aff. Roholtiella sp. LEGE 12411]
MTPYPYKLKHKIQGALRLKRALQLVWQSSPTWMIARILLLILQSTLPLLSLYLMKVIVDAVSAGIAIANKEAAFKQVALLIALTGTVNLVIALCSSIAELVNTTQAEIVTDHMYGIVHAKAIEIDLEYYENSQYHDILQRAQKEASFRPSHILNSLLQLMGNTISLVAIAGLLLWFHWEVAAILFIATVPGLFVRLKYAGEMYHWKRKRTATERKAYYLDWILTNSLYAKEIRLFDLGSLFSRRFRQLRKQLYRESLAISQRSAITGFVAQTSATLAVYGSYGIIAYQTVKGTFSIGDLIMYYQAFQRGQGALQGVLSSLAGLYEDNLFLSNLHEFLDLKPKVVEPLHPLPVPLLQQKGIKFQGVSFQYPTSDRPGLKDISLNIQPGEVVALVGENGAGKTTLIKLLCRLYDPTEGSITFEGNDLRCFSSTDLRRQISVIFQDYAKYHLTAKENIWFGNIDLPPDDKRIENAACKAGADDVINGLPNSYETILGSWFEDGEELSIGQWQKVALARAFLRDSQVIVLDEPTSALDPKAEEEVFQKFRQLINGQAAILISHRLSTVKMADCIYVMEHGRIVENGTHEELMQLGASYAHLFETQAQHYR